MVREVQAPFYLEYNNENIVPASKIAEALHAIESISEESSVVLQDLIEGVQPSGIEVHVKTIEQKSPILFDFLLPFFFEYQPNIENAIKSYGAKGGHDIIEKNSGLISTLVICMSLYGASQAVDMISEEYSPTDKTNIDIDLDLNVNIASNVTKVDKKNVYERIGKSFNTKRRKKLARDSLRFLNPGKHGVSGPAKLNGETVIKKESYKEIPDAHFFSVVTGRSKYQEMDDVFVEIIQIRKGDHFHGWRCHVPRIDERKKVKLTISPEISIDKLWTYPNVNADIIVKYSEDKSGNYQPAEVHLKNIRVFHGSQ